MDIQVGHVFSNEQLNNLPTNRGRKRLIEQKDWWFESMDNAKGDWVVLETHNNTTANCSRMRNRVSNLNKQLRENKQKYEFSTKTVDSSIVFMGTRYS